MLDRGIIQQVGSPLELYRHPANIFVAGFIGSPSMNFIDAVIRRNGADILAELADGQRLPIAAGAAVSDGQNVTLGIRPEHLVMHGTGAPLQGTIAIVEPTGAQTHLVVGLAGIDVVALIDGAAAVYAGAQFEGRVQADNIYVFDKSNGASLMAKLDQA